MNTTERMLSAAKEIWEAYNRHPFVLRIQNGTLPKDRFRYYMIQDYITHPKPHIKKTFLKYFIYKKSGLYFYRSDYFVLILIYLLLMCLFPADMLLQGRQGVP